MATPDANDINLTDGDNDGDGDKVTSTSSYTGDSGSGTAGQRKRAMQGYLQVIYNLYGVWNFTPLQQKLANQAFKYRSSPSLFLAMLRREDPRYVRTRDYKNRVADARNVYQAYRGYGRPVPKQFADQYARSGMNRAALEDKIQSTKWFRNRFPNWKQAVNAGTIGNSMSGAQAYISMRNMLNNAFRNQGQQANPLLHRMMFSAGMSESDVAQNLMSLFGGQEALKFAAGFTLDSDDIMRAALTKKYGTAGLSQVQQAANRTKTFQGSQATPFDVGVNEQSNQIVMPRI